MTKGYEERLAGMSSFALPSLQSQSLPPPFFPFTSRVAPPHPSLPPPKKNKRLKGNFDPSQT